MLQTQTPDEEREEVALVLISRGDWESLDE